MEQGIGFYAVYGQCSDGVLSGGVGFKCCDLSGDGDFFWDTRSMGEGIVSLGLCRLLGVGTVYVTSLENFAYVLFGVGIASFIFRRRVAFLFRGAAAYVMCGEVLGGVSTLGTGAGCG